MFTNFIRFARQISQLTPKSLSNNDSLVVITDKGVPKKVLSSDFTSSLIFAHVSFDGSAGNKYDGSTISGHNIKSVTRSSEGVFVVEFTTPHGTGKYTAVGSAGLGNHTSSARAVSVDEYTTTSITIRVERTDTGSQQDEAYIAIMVLG
tara:strand:+ start:5043 stop:5489 length:447 start_codon:yes stop_codon:yes gene_type:complete